MRYFICLSVLAWSASAQDFTPQQVLDKVISAYNKLKAVHMIAQREESLVGGRAQISESECELAAKAGHRYYARLKLQGQQALSVSDGNNIWRALESKKQWSKVSGASIPESDAEEDDTKSGGTDLYRSLEGIMLYRILSLAKAAHDPEIVKQQDFKLGHEKVRCYTVRARTTGSEFEFLVDQQRFIVLQYKEKGHSPEGQLEVTTKVKLVELDQDVGDSLFHFEPNPGWSEVEALVLPGERAVVLTGAHAAGFALKTLDGESVALRNLAGSVVVLDFWATWCGPCREEFPTVEKLRSEFGGAVRFYGVSDEPRGTVKKFVEEHGYEMTMLLDSNHETNRQYGIRVIPALFVIDRNGIVRAQFFGTQSESALRKAIRSALGQE